MSETQKLSVSGANYPPPPRRTARQARVRYDGMWAEPDCQCSKNISLVCFSWLNPGLVRTHTHEVALRSSWRERYPEPAVSYRGNLGGETAGRRGGGQGCQGVVGGGMYGRTKGFAPFPGPRPARCVFLCVSNSSWPSARSGEHGVALFSHLRLKFAVGVQGRKLRKLLAQDFVCAPWC